MQNTGWKYKVVGVTVSVPATVRSLTLLSAAEPVDIVTYRTVAPLTAATASTSVAPVAACETVLPAAAAAASESACQLDFFSCSDSVDWCSGSSECLSEYVANQAVGHLCCENNEHPCTNNAGQTVDKGR